MNNEPTTSSLLNVPSPAAVRASPTGSSKRKSKPVKRIVVDDEEPYPETSNAPMSIETNPVDVVMSSSQRSTPKSVEVPTTMCEEPKSNDEMLRRLTQMLNQQSSPLHNLLAAAAAGCSMPTVTELPPTTQASIDLLNLLASSLPNSATSQITPSISSLSSLPPTSKSLTLELPHSPSLSLVNSKGPVKRKLFDGKDLMRQTAPGMTKEERIDLDDLENFAQMFKKQRIKFGFTQGDVGVALGRRYGTDFSQTTISRFEALNLSFKNMCKLRPLLKEWLAEAEVAIANGRSLNDLLDRPSAPKPAVSHAIEMPKLPTTVAASTSPVEPHMKRRRKRTNLDMAQRQTLDAFFAVNPRPDHDRMTEIANILELDRDVVRVWFCNRRQKMRRTDEPEPPEDPLLNSIKMALPQSADLLNGIGDSSHS